MGARGLEPEKYRISFATKGEAIGLSFCAFDSFDSFLKSVEREETKPERVSIYEKLRRRAFIRPALS